MEVLAFFWASEHVKWRICRLGLEYTMKVRNLVAEGATDDAGQISVLEYSRLSLNP